MAFFLAKGDEQFRSFLPLKGPCFNLIYRGGGTGRQGGGGGQIWVGKCPRPLPFQNSMKKFALQNDFSKIFHNVCTKSKITSATPADKHIKKVGKRPLELLPKY